MEKLLSKILAFTCSLMLIANLKTTQAQNVNIPDVAFLTPLINNPAINTNADGFIQVTEANAYSGSILVSNLGITDLTGIESFINIDSLDCSDNLLSNLSLVNNAALIDLDCSNNQLINLDVFGCTSLLNLRCLNNGLDYLDVSNCLLLQDLRIDHNNFSSVSLFDNTALSFFSCEYNNISYLSVANNAALNYLQCGFNQLNNLDLSNNVALIDLRCNNNQLTVLPILYNTNLQVLDCNSNQLSALTLGSNPLLTYLNCANNMLTDVLTNIQPDLLEYHCDHNLLSYIDVSQNTALNFLDCGYNQLSYLDVINNPNLHYLDCGANQLTSLNLVANTQLGDLRCFNNQIDNLDLSNISTLYGLHATSNALTSLDLSNNAALYFIDCSNNLLNSLNIQNGNNMDITNFSAINNPSLTCIQVDDVSYMDTYWLGAIDASANYSVACAACTVTIPDVNFKSALVNNAVINTNGNTEIECSEAAAYNGFLMLAANNINDLTGIEAFVNLTGLNCSANFLTSIDLSNNAALTDLRCVNNQLSTIEISYCPGLKKLYCWNNQITDLNFIDNPNIDSVDCSHNLLSSLDMHANADLLFLDCSFNQIDTLNLSNNHLLHAIGCTDNALTSLNIQNGNNNSMNYFSATNNPNLTCIQVDSEIFMNNTWFNAIDATASYSNNCGACTVNIPDANFKNALVNNTAINTNGNSEIECAEAAAYNGIMNLNSLSITNLTGIEAFTSLTELQCVNNNIPTIDLSANVALVNLNVNTSHVSSLNITNNSSLVELRCQNNQLTNLNLTNNSALNLLYCFNNNLTSLNISNNNLLSEIDCRNNDIVSLNTNNLSYLTYLDCSVNQLQYLDFSSNIYLNELYCQENALISLNIQNGNNDNFLYFDATANSALTCVQVDDVTYMNTNWSSAIDATASYNTSCSACIVTIPDLIFKNALVTNFAINTNGNSEIECSEAVNYADTIYVTDLGIDDLTGIEAFISITGLVCNLNNLTSLDLSSNTALQFLHAYDNQLTSLNVTNNPALINLWISNNNLDSIDVTHNLMLEGLACFNNNFTNIDVTQNLALKDFRCAFNPLTTVDVSNNTQLELWYTGNCLINTLDLSNNLMLKQLDCGPNQLTTLDLSNNIALMTLEAGQNDLVALDVSNNPALSTIYVNGNALTSLNISNGNNANLNGFSAVNNPNLTCIQVDDVSLMNSNWSAAKDATASYDTNCPVSCPAIPIAFNATSTSITATPMNAVFSNATPNLLNYNFVWYFGDGSMLASNDASITHTYYYNGVYAVTLIAYDINTGCSDTLYQSNYMTCNATGALSCNHTVALNPSGVINACQESIVPIASTTNLTTATYQWNRNGVIIGGASQENYYVDANGNYTLTVFNAQGCPITSSPVQVNYSLQSSVPPIISATGTANACGDVNVMLTAAGSFSNYLWSNGQTGNNINVTQGGSYTVIGQSPACDAVSLAYNIAGSVAPVPPICMVTVDETDNRNIVIWEKPVSLAIDSFLVLREEMNNPGIYHIIGAQSYVELSEFKDLGADANASAYRYKLAVMDTCGGITIPSDEQRSMHLDVAQGNSVLARQLTWNVYQGQPQAFNYYLIYRETSPGSSILALIDSVPSTQTWYYDNSLTNILDTARAYKVAYRVSSPCVSSRAQNDICSSNVIANERPVVDGLKSISDQAFRWTIAPNPNDGKFVLQTTAQGNIQLSVFNLIGEELYHQQINSPQTTIDLRALSNGVYMLNLNDGKSSVTKRLVVTK